MSILTTVQRQASAEAAEAFVFTFPLVLTDLARPRSAQPNRFVHGAELGAWSGDAVAGPDLDMLHSSAWLDLTAEPVVLSVPDTGGRYYVLEMSDAWTSVFAAPG